MSTSKGGQTADAMRRIQESRFAPETGGALVQPNARVTVLIKPVRRYADGISYQPFGPGQRLVPIPPSLFDRFIRLESDAQIVKFAQAWGPLGVCQHGLALGVHLVGAATEPCRPVVSSSSRRDGRLITFGEMFQTWRIVAGRVRTLLAIGADLDAGRPLDSQELERTFVDDERREWVQRKTPAAGFLFELAVASFVKGAGVYPRFTWDPRGVQLTAQTLLGALAIDLLSVIARPSPAYAVCAWCRGPINLARRRRPADGTRPCCGRKKCTDARNRANVNAWAKRRRADVDARA